MNTNLIRRTLIALVCAGALMVAGIGRCADAKAYQVTGPVLEVTPTTLTVQKGDEKWQLSRTPGTKVKGDLKVGAKVTVYYSMVATDIEVKPAKAETKEQKPEGQKKKTS
jgi:hypothetical protein